MTYFFCNLWTGYPLPHSHGYPVLYAFFLFPGRHNEHKSVKLYQGEKTILVPYYSFTCKINIKNYQHRYWWWNKANAIWQNICTLSSPILNPPMSKLPILCPTNNWQPNKGRWFTKYYFFKLKTQQTRIMVLQYS